MDMQTAVSPSSAPKADVTPGGDFLVISIWDRAKTTPGPYFVVHSEELRQEGDRFRYIGPDLKHEQPLLGVHQNYDRDLRTDDFARDIGGPFHEMSAAQSECTRMNAFRDWSISETRQMERETEGLSDIESQNRLNADFAESLRAAELIASAERDRIDHQNFRDFDPKAHWDSQPMLDLSKAVHSYGNDGGEIARAFASGGMPLSAQTLGRLEGLSGDNLLSDKVLGVYLLNKHGEATHEQLDTYLATLQETQKNMRTVLNGYSLHEAYGLRNTMEHPSLGRGELAEISQMRKATLVSAGWNPTAQNSAKGPDSGTLGPDLNRTYKRRADHPAELAARTGAERASKDISKQLSQTRTGKHAAHLPEVLKSCNTAIEDRNGGMIREIGTACELYTPSECSERFESLASNNLLKAPAVADIFCKSGNYSDLNAHLIALELLQAEMHKRLANDKDYQKNALGAIESKFDLSPAELGKTKTLLSEGRLLPSDVNDLTRNASQAAEAEFKKLIDKSFRILENSKDRGFGRGLA